MRDFTQKPRVVEFKIDDDVFRGKPVLPAQTMVDFSVAAEKFDVKSATAQQGFESMLGALEMVLMADSFKRFKHRMQDPEKLAEEARAAGQAAPEPFIPIGLDQIPSIVEYLMEEYGMRPTEPSEESSDGPSSLAPGTSSTENTSPVALISASSPSIAS
jgi:hypothetical protein